MARLRFAGLDAGAPSFAASSLVPWDGALVDALAATLLAAAGLMGMDGGDGGGGAPDAGAGGAAGGNGHDEPGSLSLACHPEERIS